MENPTFVVPLIAAALAVVLAIAFFVSRSRKERFLALGQLLDERPRQAAGFFTLSLEGHYRERPARFRLVPGGKNQPPRFHAALGCGTSISFDIYHQNFLTRIGAALKLVKDLEIGDPNLDPEYVFSCRDEAPFASWLRGSGEARDALKRLMDDRRVEHLRLREGFLEAIRTCRSREVTDPDNVRPVMDDLERLVRTL